MLLKEWNLLQPQYLLSLKNITHLQTRFCRYVRHRSEAEKAVVVVAPPYERVGSVIEPVAKEYEVQVYYERTLMQ